MSRGSGADDTEWEALAARWRALEEETSAPPKLSTRVLAVARARRRRRRLAIAGSLAAALGLVAMLVSMPYGQDPQAPDHPQALAPGPPVGADPCREIDSCVTAESRLAYLTPVDEYGPRQ